jgi:acyl-coenzyme A thioesterase PaaI-like protein
MRGISPTAFVLFLWRALPAAAFMGIRLEKLDEQECVTRMRLGWRNRNPFRSIYFAAQTAAAEMASGLPAFLAVREGGGAVSMLVTGMESRFHRKATGTVHFVFGDVRAIREQVHQATKSSDPLIFTAEIRAFEVGKNMLLAEFAVQWRFRRKLSVPPPAS